MTASATPSRPSKVAGAAARLATSLNGKTPDTSTARRVVAQSTASDWHMTDPWVRFGNRTVYWMFGGLIVASMLFSVSGAVVATGTVSVEGEYKTVQHLEGGIVAKILVRNGDRVRTNQPLVQLDNTQALANMTATSNRANEYNIQQARLIAERDRKDSFEAPSDVDLTDGDARKILDAQKTLFETRRVAYLGQQKVLVQKVSQIQSELGGVAAQLTARIKQRELNEKELSTVRPLFEKGYVNQQRIGPLERESVQIGGDIANLKAEISKLKSGLLEAEARLAQADKDYSQQAAEELQRIQPQLSEAVEGRKALGDRLARTTVAAPASGIVHALAVHTVGGVVAPGSALLQIIPDDRELVVETRFAPKDLDSVRVGQEATVRFSAFDAHTTPKLTGRVKSVSAAEVTDKEGKSYFSAQIEISQSELLRLESGQHLMPGMPAEVYIETRSRTILSYFLKPLGDMMAGTFRER